MELSEKLLAAIKVAEQSLLGLAIVRPEPTALPDIDPAEFYDRRIGNAYRLAVSMREANRGVLDTRRFGVEVQGIDHAELGRIIADSPLAIHDPTDYAEEVLQFSAMRRLGRAAQSALIELQSEAIPDPIRIASRLEAQLAAIQIADKSTELISVGDAVQDALREHRRAIVHGRPAGISTGLLSLDRETGGLHPGSLWLLGARSFVGKSALALQIAAHVARQKDVVFVSAEMTATEHADRLLSLTSGVEFTKFARATLTANELEEVERFAERIAKLRISFSNGSGESFETIRAKARIAAAKGTLGLVVVDHLQLLKPANYRAPRHEQLCELSRSLKQLALELNTTVLLLTQLSVEAEGKEPSDAHYAGAKGILSDADVALLMSRETKSAERTTLKITKNRRGTIAELQLKFFGNVQRFTEDFSEPWEG